MVTGENALELADGTRIEGADVVHLRRTDGDVALPSVCCATPGYGI